MLMRRFLMKMLVRMAAAASVFAALVGVSSLVTAKGRPAPPPPVLCGCACPDGSIIITHAPDAESCPAVCASVCPSDM
jgi:hypothetical protein